MGKTAGSPPGSPRRPAARQTPLSRKKPPSLRLFPLPARFQPPSGQCPDPGHISQQVSTEEISAAITSTSSTSAPGPDGIPNKLLKAMKVHLAEPLGTLTAAALTAGYHPTAFRTSVTMPLKKAQKPNYGNRKAWRRIALLKTIGKVMEGGGSKAPRRGRVARAFAPDPDGMPSQQVDRNRACVAERANTRDVEQRRDRQGSSGRHVRWI